MKFKLAVVFSVVLLASSLTVKRTPVWAQTTDSNIVTLTFETDIRPILKVHCFHCHGEQGHREADLDLRLRRAMVEGGDSGAVIVPGDSESSYLLERIINGEMPPGEDKHLADDEIATIRQWIEQGASVARQEPESLGDGPYFTREELDHWAYQPVRKPELPAIQHPQLARQPLDYFILSKLEHSATLSQLNPPAQLEALVRRVAFDLTGLPPDPEQLAAVLSDPAPDAYERYVDQLLASPRYGERWGRHWLDTAGYADSEGYNDADEPRPHAFRYRDYVIRSLNRDKPFNRFIIEQLAGDELVAHPYKDLESAEVECLSATGFLRMAPDGTGSGGGDPNVARNQVMADTLQIVSSSFLGLTVECARCHDHKYDAISQLDYYRFRAVFEPALNWKQWKAPADRRVSLYTDADRELASTINAEAAQVDAEREEKAQQYIARTLEEELLLVDPPQRDALRTAFQTEAGKRTAEQKQLLKDHPSVANIRESSLYLYDRRREAKARKLDVQRKDRAKALVAETALDQLAMVPESIRDEVKAARESAVERRTERQRELLRKYPGVLVNESTLSQYNPAGAEALEVLEELKREADELRATKASDDLKRYADRAAEIRARIPEEGFVRALTEPEGEPPVTQLFERGDHEQPAAEVQPAGLSVVAISQGSGGAFEQSFVSVEETPPHARLPVNDDSLSSTGRRLAYARYLTSGRHPLVARVLVNRVWRHHFGRGLVETAGDFGVLGTPPTHPELLDWLAAEFVESDWSMKHMHRLIVTSAVYRQSSRSSADLAASDPDNRLHGRMTFRRLEAETFRDAVLAVSGQLVLKQFGPPVPVMEDEVGQIVIGIENLDGERKPGERISLDGDEFRRSIYVQMRRSRPLGVLETFDLPAMDPNCTVRNASNVATQSLLLMNSNFLLESSAALANRVFEEVGEDPAQRVHRLWWLVYGREPAEQELASALRFLDRQTSTLTQSQQAAGSKANATPATEGEAQFAREAFASLCHALLSSNEFLYVP